MMMKISSQSVNRILVALAILVLSLNVTYFMIKYQDNMVLHSKVMMKASINSKWINSSNKFQQWENVNVSRCQKPVEDILFLKTHKTGSSTITSILNRYADIHNLSMQLPVNGLNRFLWPQKFSKSYAAKNYPLYANGANILANHARFRKKEMDKVMKNNSKYITILRNPIQLFESSFNYFGFDQQLKLKGRKDPMRTFLNSSKAYYKNLSRGGTFGLFRNGMLYDLGYDTDKPGNILNMSKVIQQVERDFDLVLIMEYFDESLVLLMRTFCWTFDDILYMKQNERIKKVQTLSKETGKLIIEWNKEDYELYQSCNKTFWRKIDEHGDSFWHDVREFKTRIIHMKQRCDISGFQAKAHASNIIINKFKVGKNISLAYAQFCKKLLLSEVDYIKYFRKQYNKQNKPRV